MPLESMNLDVRELAFKGQWGVAGPDDPRNGEVAEWFKAAVLKNLFDR